MSCRSTQSQVEGIDRRWRRDRDRSDGRWRAIADTEKVDGSDDSLRRAIASPPEARGAQNLSRRERQEVLSKFPRRRKITRGIVSEICPALGFHFILFPCATSKLPKGIHHILFCNILLIKLMYMLRKTEPNKWCEFVL